VQIPQDMHLFLHNIVLYNGPSSDFGKLSNRVGKVFEDAWASAGLAGDSSAIFSALFSAYSTSAGHLKHAEAAALPSS